MRAVIVCAATCVTALLLSFGPAPARAAEAHAHDGFYLRWTTGLGTASAKGDIDNGPGYVTSPFKFKGLAGEGDVAIGFTRFKKLPLALHATVWGWRVNDPEMEDPDNLVTAPGTTGQKLNGVLSAGAVGVGATCFMRYNTYLSVSAGTGKLSLKEQGTKADDLTLRGLAVDAAVGKEWWVAPSWGIGFAGGLNYFSAKAPKVVVNGVTTQDDWRSVSYSLRLSATYN